MIENLRPGQLFKYRGYFYARSKLGRVGYKDVFNDMRYWQAVGFLPTTKIYALNKMCIRDRP